MKTLTLIPVLLLLVSACSTVVTKPAQMTEQSTDSEVLELKSGSYLFINKDGMMRMTDRNGKPITMKNGVEMELKNGDLIMMKGSYLWRHRPPKGRVHYHNK